MKHQFAGRKANVPKVSTPITATMLYIAMIPEQEYAVNTPQSLWRIEDVGINELPVLRLP